MTPSRLIDAFIDRLIELAAGAEPYSRELGIGHDINANVAFLTFSDFLWDAINRAMPDTHVDFWKPGDHWSGPRGKRRRKLCFDVAVQAMASAGGDYRGKYS